MHTLELTKIEKFDLSNLSGWFTSVDTKLVDPKKKSNVKEYFCPPVGLVYRVYKNLR